MMVLVNDRISARHDVTSMQLDDMTDTTPGQPVPEEGEPGDVQAAICRLIQWLTTRNRAVSEGTANVGEGRRRGDEECQNHDQA